MKFEYIVLFYLFVFTLFFVNQLRLYDNAVQSRVLDEREKHKKSTSRCVQAASLPSGSEKPYISPICPRTKDDGAIALLVLCYNRKVYLEKTMKSIRQYIPPNNFPIILSQDGNAQGMTKFIRDNFEDVIHIRNFPRQQEHTGNLAHYYYIADHYYFALTKVFDVLKFETVVIIEDDMEIAPDFFNYFFSLAPLLHRDPSLLCVSAWNDNGMKPLVSDPEELRRTSVFPGLGWMMTRALWEELKVKWPKGFWDDWLREPEQTRGRHCIHPAVSRSRTFGEMGSSSGQFFKKYLAKIMLNVLPVKWDTKDFGYLDEKQYETRLMEKVQTAKLVSVASLQKELVSATQSLKVEYGGEKEYATVANIFNLMPDLKAGLPRGSINGILSVPCCAGNELFIVPKEKQTK